MAKRANTTDLNGMVRATKRMRLGHPGPSPGVGPIIGLLEELRNILYGWMDLTSKGRLASTCRAFYRELADANRNHASRNGGHIWIPQIWHDLLAYPGSTVEWSVYHNGIRRVLSILIDHEFFRKIPRVALLTRAVALSRDMVCTIHAVEAMNLPPLRFTWQRTEGSRDNRIQFQSRPAPEAIEAFMQPLIAEGQARRAKVYQSPWARRVRETRHHVNALYRERLQLLKQHKEIRRKLPRVSLGRHKTVDVLYDAWCQAMLGLERIHQIEQEIAVLRPRVVDADVVNVQASADDGGIADWEDEDVAM